jgi:dihydrofolate reductase
MRKLIYMTMLSLDGLIEDENQGLDWASIDEELHNFVNQKVKGLGAFLYGRRMYSLMSEYWPTADQDLSNPGYIIEYSQIWKAIPKLVFSNTLQSVEGNATLIKEDLIQVVKRLKEEPGGDFSLGGAVLAAPLIQNNLIDEYQLYIHPVILGKGVPWHPTLEPSIPLKLVETHSFGSGVIFLRYQRQESNSGNSAGGADI